jgi:Cu/Ag efflux protein CusF
MTTYLAMMLVSASLAANAPEQAGAVKAMTATATIQAIDAAARTVTIRDEKGHVDTFSVGSEVPRFNELKVGDKVRATYFESIVLRLRKPGDTAPTGAVDAAVNRGQGALPAASIDVREQMTVTVKAIDPATSSITVAAPDGREATRKVQDKTLLTGVKVGDKIDITYRRAALVT